MKSYLLMGEISEDLHLVRSRICDVILVSSALLSVPAVLASVFRSSVNGWYGLMGLHIAATSVIFLLWVFRKSLPFNLKAGAIVLVFMTVGLTGFWRFGMISGANPLLLVAPVLATVLFGRRIGVGCAIILVSMMMLTAYSFVFGGRVFQIDFNVSGTFLPSWIAYLFGMVLAFAAAVAAISMSNRHLSSAMIKSRHNQDELTLLNRDLENQVLERTQDLENAKIHAEQQARTDVLTGLNNRRAFFEYAGVIDGQARRYNHPYVVAMIDIDHFKTINDTWGHDTGDAALITIGRVITQTLRETDIIGRVGGEEFAIIMPETVAKEGMSLVERLRKVVEEIDIQTPKCKIKLTASIGLAAFDDLSETLERVVANSDVALYRAKNSGRNRIEFYGS